jgi:hypothetical protein
MQTFENSALDMGFLGALADLLMQAGRDRAADVVYAAIEAETAPAARPALRLVHSADPV